MVYARVVSLASQSRLRSLWLSWQVSHELLVSEVVASPSWWSLSLFLSFPMVRGCMVLQAVEISQIIKCSNPFIPVFSSTVVWWMNLFTFNCCSSPCWSLNGLECNLNSFQAMWSSITVRASLHSSFPVQNPGVWMVLKAVWILTTNLTPW